MIVTNGLETVDVGVLLLDFVDRQAAGVVRRFRMIGDADVMIAAGETCLDHRLQRVGAV